MPLLSLFREFPILTLYSTHPKTKMAWIAASIYEGMQITYMQASVKFETSTQIPLPITSFFLTGGEFSFRPCCDMHSGKGPQTRTGSG